jgi:hypothetical protein
LPRIQAHPRPSRSIITAHISNAAALVRNTHCGRPVSSSQPISGGATDEVLPLQAIAQGVMKKLSERVRALRVQSASWTPARPPCPPWSFAVIFDRAANCGRSDVHKSSIRRRAFSVAAL